MKLIIIISIFISISVSSFGQTIPTPDEIAAKDAAMMAQKLELSAAQQKQIEAINKVHFKAFWEVRNSKDSIAVRKQKLDQLTDNRTAAFKKILTEAQYARYQEDMKKIRAQFEQRNMELKRKYQGTTLKPDSLRNRQ